MRYKISFVTAIYAALAVAVIVEPAQATLYWDPSGSGSTASSGITGTWNTSLGLWYNGSADSAWISGSDAEFSGIGGAVTVGAAVTAHNIAFDVTGYTLSGSSIITLNGTTPTISVANVTDSATISSVLAGSAGLTKSGNGTLIVSGVNTFTGGVNISAGTLQISSMNTKANAQPLGKGDVTLSGGTLLYTTGLGSAASVDQSFNLAANATSTIKLNGSGTSDSGSINSTGGITGSGNLILTTGANASARLIMQGNNSFTGTVTINSGSLQTAYQASGYQLGNNATLVVNGGGITAGMGSENTSASYTINVGALSGTGGFVQPSGVSSSAGTTTFSIGGRDTSTSYAGVIRNGPSSTAPRIAALAKVGSGTLTLTGVNTYTGITTISNGAIQLGDGTSSHDGSTAGVSIVNNAALVYNLFGSSTYSGVISGTGTLTKNGLGTLTLSGVNTYTGLTAVLAGTLNVTGSLANNGYGSVYLTASTGNAATILQAVSSGSLANYGSTGIGTLTTHAKFLAGTTSSSLSMSWRDATAAERNLSGNTSTGIISEVLTVSGITADSYVLNMSYDSVALKALGGTSTDGIYIAYLKDTTWTDICDGKNLGDYSSGTYADVGNWGVNTDGTVWVVTGNGNTNGSFAVVPEPNTLALLAGALLSLIVYAWRRRK